MADNKDPFAEFGGQALSKEDMDELGFQPEVPSVKPERTQAQKIGEEAAALGRGAAYGASLGTAPAIEEAAAGVGELFKGKLPVLPGTPEFKQKVLERAKPYVESKKEYPLQYGLGEFVGTAATSLPLSAGAAATGKAVSGLISETAPLARGLTKAATEAAGEAGIGAAISAAQGQKLSEGAVLGAAGSLGGQALRGVSKIAGKAPEAPAAMREAAIEAAPETLRPAAREMAESPQKFEQYQTARYKLEKPGGLEEQLKGTQAAEEAKFQQVKNEVVAANKQKTSDYKAALKEEDRTQLELLKQSTDAVKKARTEKAANDLSEAVRRGLDLQKQKATAKYDIAYSSMTDQLDPAKSEVSRLSNGFQGLDDYTRIYAEDTNSTIGRLATEQSRAAGVGAYTTGKELKGLVELDQSLSSDLKRLNLMQKADFNSNRQDAIARLNAIKQDVNQSINNTELGIPKDAVDQYNQAKAHYADYAKARDELREAKLLVSQKIDNRRIVKPTAKAAAEFLAPKVEDVMQTQKALEAFKKLPEGLTPEQFTQMKQMATTMPAGLLPERTRPIMPAPQLQEVPTQRVITPEEAALQGQVDVQRGMASEFEELSKPIGQPKMDFIPGQIGKVQKATGIGLSPAQRISRAQAVERAFQNPALSFAVKVLEGQKKVFTLPMVQMLARQYQVDPMELQKALAEQQAP